MSSPAAAEPGAPAPGTASIRLSVLARPPRPEEEQVLKAAALAALGLPATPVPSPPAPWRTAERWWPRG